MERRWKAMLLSKPQKDLLEMVRQYGAVRTNQAGQLLRQKYTGLNFDTIVHQMGNAAH